MQQNYPTQPSTINSFEILKSLGKGAFGAVYQVKHKQNGQIYAMKKVNLRTLSTKERQNALNEVRILASFDSPYIIQYKEAFYDDASSHLCLVMEFAENGDLQNKISSMKKQGKQLDEDTVWNYSAQMLMALKYLHSMNILHRDLKGANVFLSNDMKEIKLGDMNISKHSENYASTQTGTPYYLSPEVWKGEPYGNKCDIWSLGCVVYEMVAQNPPFTG